MHQATRRLVERHVPEVARATERHAGAETAFEYSAFLLLGTTVLLTFATGFAENRIWLGLFAGAFALALFLFAFQAFRRRYWESQSSRLKQESKPQATSESRVLPFPSRDSAAPNHRLALPEQ